MRGKKKVYNYPDVTMVRDLSYLEDSQNPDYCLDIYRPKSYAKPLPVIIDIHGGGLVYGNKELNKWTSAEMARRGYIVIALNYPLIPIVTLYEQVQIILKAFNYIESLHSIYNMDLDKVYLKGDSAGGLLSILLCGTHCMRHNEGEVGLDAAPFTIKALALVHSLVDTRRGDILDFISSHKLPKDPPNCCDPVVYENPENLIQYLPPVWMVTSKNDFMFYNESQRFSDQLRVNNKIVHYHEFDYSLTRPLHHVFMISHPHLEESQMLYDSLHQFLKAV